MFISAGLKRCRLLLLAGMLAAASLHAQEDQEKLRKAAQNPVAGLGYGAFKAIRKDDESPVRAAAALRLARDPDPKSAEALATAAADEKWLVRVAAIDAIGQRGDATLLKAIVPRLDDDNETVRFNAAACILRLSK